MTTTGVARTRFQTEAHLPADRPHEIYQCNFGGARMYRILCVDDEKDLLEIGKLFLEQNGMFEVDTVLSGSAALLAIKSVRYDAIISDYQMLNMDGIQLLRQIRKEHGDIPFILFTGRGREEVVIEAINNGADSYLQKGGDPTVQFAELEHKTLQLIRGWVAEQTLLKNEIRFRSILHAATEFITIIGADGRFTYTSPSHETILGYPEGSLLGKDPLDYIHPEDTVRMREELNHCLMNEHTKDRYTFRFRDQAGAWHDMECRFSNLFHVPEVRGLIVTSWIHRKT